MLAGSIFCSFPLHAFKRPRIKDLGIQAKNNRKSGIVGPGSSCTTKSAKLHGFGGVSSKIATGRTAGRPSASARPLSQAHRLKDPAADGRGYASSATEGGDPSQSGKRSRY